jgi:hypothetical protein
VPSAACGRMSWIGASCVLKTRAQVTGVVPLAMATTGAAVACALVLAGCGTAPGPALAANHARGQRTYASAVPGPAGGSPALARAVARRLIGKLVPVLPGGAHRIGPRAEPKRAEVMVAPTLVDKSRFFFVPLPVGAVGSYLQAHPPAGMKYTGDGVSGDVVSMVIYMMKAAPPGIDYGTELLASLGPGKHGGTVLRADAEVIWYPPRSAAEYLYPGRYRAVAIHATFSGHKPATISRTFTSARVIGGLAALFNHMRAVTPGTIYGCPPVGTSFQIAFTPAGHRPVVTVGPSYCLGDSIVVGGKRQPALADFNSGRAFALMARLLGVPAKDA